MAMAVNAAATGSNARIIRYLVLTILVGGVFLAHQGHRVLHRISRASRSRSELQHRPSPLRAETGWLVRQFDEFEHWFHDKTGAQEPPDQRNRKEELFMLFYFIMTAIHATHMIIGIGVMLVLIAMAKRKVFSAKYHNPVEMFGLYWHFVDIVWVFLFPTLYLLRQP